MADRQRDWPLAMTTTSTHDTKRGEDVRARIAVLAEVPELWADALDRLLSLAPLARPVVRQPALAGGRRRLAGVARASARLRREGDARGRRPHDVDRAGRGVRAARCTRPSTRRSTTPRCGGARRPASARVAGPGWSNAVVGQAGRADDARRARRLPGQRAVGAVAWSTPTTGGRSTSAYAARCWPGCSAGERPVLTPHLADPGDAKLLVTQAALTLRRNQPHRFTTYDPVDVRGRGRGSRRWPSTAAARSRSRPGSRSGWPREAGATPSLSLPDGDWADLLTGREHAGAAPLHDCWPTTRSRC